MNITEPQLKAIEAALTFTGDPLEAHKACKAIRDNIATAKELQLARDETRGIDDISIDDDAGTSPYEEGTWVQAWVHLLKPTKECDTCNGTGRVVPDVLCKVCTGQGETYLEFDEDTP